MKTIRVSNEQMQKRIARYGSLKPLPIQNPSIPEEARDVVYSRKLLSVIGLNTAALQSMPARRSPARRA